MPPRRGLPRRAALAALALLCVRASAAEKLDARLRTQRGIAAHGMGVAATGTIPGASFPVLIRVAAGTTLEALRASYPSARFDNAAGPIVTANVPDAALARLEADPRVLSVEGAKTLHPYLDVARSNQTASGLYLGVTRNAAAADLANLDGTGVVVGIVDTGIDFRHQDFIASGGASRILNIWDQTDAGGPGPSGIPGFSASYGTDWSNAQINASIPSGGPVREYDNVGHGTHVAGIAAGNGRGGSAPGTYVGLAPKADIVVVKTNFTTNGIVDGVKYVQARAAALGKPAVINLSLGGQIDPHDGTGGMDAGVGAVAASVPVVAAMGNDGTGVAGWFPHAQVASFPNGQATTFNATAAAGGTLAELDFWTGSPSAASAARFSVTVTVNGTACVTKADGTGTGGAPVACAGQNVYVDNNDALVGFAGNDTNTPNDREIYVAVQNGAGFSATVNVAVTLTCTSASGCGQVDAFSDPEGERVNFTAGAGYATPATLTMGAPATANNVIAVGSYATKHNWSPGDGFTYFWDNSVVGDLSVFSGQGPSRDGRQKPDVAAPGDVIASSLSSQAALCSTCTIANKVGTFNQLLPDGAHAIMAGTSMATPVVTGALALRLQGFPSRTVSQLRAILQGLARSDAGVTLLGSVPNTGFGYGKVVASPQPVSPATGLSASVLGTSSITWSWSASVVGADAYDLYYATNPSVAAAKAVQPPLTLAGLPPNATFQFLLYGEGGGIDGPAAVFVATGTYAPAPGAAPTATPWVSSVTVAYPACAVGVCSGYAVQVSTSADFSTSYSSSVASSAQTSLVVSGLAGGVGYFIRYGHLNPMGAPNYGPMATFSTGSGLAAPVTPSFDQITASQVRFNWGQGANPPGLTYFAQASTAADYSGTLQSIVASGFSATFTGLGADTSYYFRVQGVGGPFLNAGPQAPLALPPAAPASPFSALSSSGLTVAWTNAGDQPDTLYEADLSPASDFSAAVVSSFTRNASASFAGLTPNTVYYARAAAISRSGAYSSFTSLASTATLVQPPTLPGAPLSAQAADGFAFAFNSANPPGTRYLVRVATDAAFSTLAASSNTAATSAAFAGLQSDQFYWVSVAALNQLGSPTAFTAPVGTATVVVPPAALAAPVSTRTVSSFGFAWGAGTLAPGTTYLAQVSSSPAFAFNVLSSTTLNLSATFAGLTANTTWYGRVQALGLFPPTPSGPFASAAAGSTLPNPPGAAASPFPNVAFTSATVAWAPLPLFPPGPQSAAAEGYRVDLATSPDFGGTLVTATAGAASSSATVSGLSFATLYYARVGALSWDGYADYLYVGSTTTLLPALSSGAMTASGLSLSVPSVFPQLTQISVAVPPGAFPAGTPIVAMTDLTAVLTGAMTNEVPGLTPIGAGVAIDLSAGGLQPVQPVRVTLGYDPTQLPAGQDERRLHLLRWDPSASQWTLVPSQDDAAQHVLTAFVPHFSVFAPFFVTPAGDLSAVQAFPQPWEIGDSQSPYWASALTFSGLPAGARVRIFTVLGEEVVGGSASAGGVFTWDGGNRYGKRAASGTYYAVFDSGGAHKTRRVVIIR